MQKKSLLTVMALIVVGGIVVLGMFTGFLALGQTATSPTSTTTMVNYNASGSYGITGLPELTLKPTADTPSFISDALSQERGVILLAYIEGAADDNDMLASFNAMKAEYAADASFFSFEARDVSQLGDVLNQLRVNAPPALAVIRADGTVYQIYTGWIGRQVMEQVVSNAVKL